MSEKYKAFDLNSPYFITFTLVEWQHLFHITQFAKIIIDSIKYCQANKELELLGYCIMPSHIHLIVRSEKNSLGSVIRDLKKYTAYQITQELAKNPNFLPILDTFATHAQKIKRNKTYKVWQDGYHPMVITSNRIFYQKLKYIHDNPVKAGLASSPEQFMYSSARNYAELDGVLEIIFEMPQLITCR
jgi:putative transposase